MADLMDLYIEYMRVHNDYDGFLTTLSRKQRRHIKRNNIDLAELNHGDFQQLMNME